MRTATYYLVPKDSFSELVEHRTKPEAIRALADLTGNLNAGTEIMMVKVLETYIKGDDVDAHSTR